jgi:hypothetical protein
MHARGFRVYGGEGGVTGRRDEFDMEWRQN